MRYHTRQRLKRGLAVAWQRTRFRARPEALRHRALLDCVDWSRVDSGAEDPARLWDHFRDAKWSSLEYFVNQDDIDWYRDEDPFRSHADLVSRADAIVDHRIPILGIGDVQFGERIDWYKDPVSGTRFPSGLFSSRPERGVDGRFRTELNLHRHFPILALAWRLTGDARFLNELVAQWHDWIVLNPPIDDAFISDGLELAIRIVTWTHCLHLLGKATLDPRFYLDVLEMIFESAKLIEKNYDGETTGNNHQIAEGFGLFFTGLLYPELEAAERWRTKGLGILEEQARAQFLPGGVHAEQSASYHNFVLECYQMSALLAQRNGVALAQSLWQDVEEATRYLDALTLPDGSLLSMGDAAFKFFCPTGDARYHPRTYLDVGSHLFGARYRLDSDRRQNEESFWLMGKYALRTIGGDRHSGEGAGVSITCRAGHVFARCGEGASGEYLHFDCAPHGLMPGCGHGHDDALSVDYVVKGQSILVDPGTFTYVRRHPMREYFAGGRGHNGIILDGVPAAKRGTRPFGWTEPVDGEMLELAASGSLLWAVGRHRGYADRESGAVVERSLLSVLGEYLIVVDRITGSGTSQIESLFHFAPSLQIALQGSTAVVDSEQARVRLHWAGTGPSRATLHRGDDPIQPGWYSPCYGMQVASTVLRIHSAGRLPAWRAVAFIQGEPDADSTFKSLAVEPACFQDASRDWIALSIDAPDGKRDRLLVNWGNRALCHWGIESEARMLFFRERETRRELRHFGGAVRVVQEGVLSDVECVPLAPIAGQGGHQKSGPRCTDPQ